MTGEDKMYELMTQMYSDFSNKFQDIARDFKELKEEVGVIHKTVIKIENVHGDKLSALFHGWKQNTEQLERIENQVSRHEEVILKKIL